MAYCAVSDVQPFFPQVQFNAQTPVTLTDVTALCNVEIPNYIDRRLSKFYQVPITGSNSLQLLNTVAKKLVASEIAARLMMSGAMQESAVGKGWRAEAEAVLKDLGNSVIVLDDAVVVADTPTKWSQMFTNGTDPKNQNWDGSQKAPLFTREDVW